MQVQSLGQKDPLEEGMTTHSSILACRIPWTEDPGGLQSMGLQRLPRSKCLLISWMQSLSTMILEPPKINSVTTSTFSPSICHKVMGLDATI